MLQHGSCPSTALPPVSPPSAFPTAQGMACPLRSMAVHTARPWPWRVLSVPLPAGRSWHHSGRPCPLAGLTAQQHSTVHSSSLLQSRTNAQSLGGSHHLIHFIKNKVWGPCRHGRQALTTLSLRQRRVWEPSGLRAAAWRSGAQCLCVGGRGATLGTSSHPALRPPPGHPALHAPPTCLPDHAHHDVCRPSVIPEPLC